MHLAVLAWVISAVSALLFELDASQHGTRRCIRDFVGTETLVVLKAKIDGNVNDGQRVEMKVIDNHGNQYVHKDSIVDSIHQTFTPSRDSSFDVCFTNYLEHSTGSQGRRFRQIEMEIYIGTAARDWEAYQAAEKMKPAELTLKQLSDKTRELIQDLDYMTSREESLRNTNESTNKRVKNFFILITFAFIGLGVWQITYLRSYFRSKHIL